MLPEPPNAIFFNEGHGYLFVKTLGQGQFGCASLVRSRYNDALYVRKEELELSEFHPGYQPKNRPGREVMLALKAQLIDNVYKLKGWVRHINSAHKTLEVSYWGFCNLGSVDSVHAAAHHYDQRIPESVIVRWLTSMLTTMVQVQQAGIQHRDTHAGNWLLHAEHGTVKIVLGDFGCGRLREECTQKEWLLGCRADFFHSLQIIYTLCGFTTKRSATKISLVPAHLLSRYSRDFVQILAALDQITEIMPQSTTHLHQRIGGCTAALSRVALRPIQVATLRYLQPTPLKTDFAAYEQARAMVAKNRTSFKLWNLATVYRSSRGNASKIKIWGVPREFQDQRKWTLSDTVNEAFEQPYRLGVERYEILD